MCKELGLSHLQFTPHTYVLHYTSLAAGSALLPVWVRVRREKYGASGQTIHYTYYSSRGQQGTVNIT